MPRPLFLLLTLLALTGCQSGYVVPNNTTPLLSRYYEHPGSPAGTSEQPVPLAHFPASIAIARVAGDSEDNLWIEDPPEGEAMEHVVKNLRALPMVSGVVTLTRMAVGGKHDRAAIMAAARQYKADLVLLYSIETRAQGVDDSLPPLGILTLGLSPTFIAKSTLYSSAMLVDAQTGYVYGVASANDTGRQLSNAWTGGAAMEQVTARVQDRLLEKLFADFTGSWPTVIAGYATAR